MATDKPTTEGGPAVGGEVRRAVIDYMNRRKRFAFIPASHVARDLGISSKGGRRMVREDLDLLATEKDGGVKRRTKRIKHYDVEMYARMVAKIPEDVGVPEDVIKRKREAEVVD
jgi:hypothetical protein